MAIHWLGPLIVVAAGVFAAANVAQANDSLTPMGSIRSGSADGSIPRWTGGIATPPKGYKAGNNHVDPFRADKPLLTITGKNWRRFEKRLSEAHVALFRAYPDTFRMVVYPTRRSCALPENVYAAIAQNKSTAELVDDGGGLTGMKFGTPFPEPKTGVEIVWNHLARYRGAAFLREQRAFIVRADGTQDRFYVVDAAHWPWANAGEQPSLSDHWSAARYREPGALLFALSKAAVFKGDRKKWTNEASAFLFHQGARPVTSPSRAWHYSPSFRRVKIANQIAYDHPSVISQGLTTTDSDDGFSGSPDRYEWTLVGRMEAYVPFNNYALDSQSLKNDEFTTPWHLNPQSLRYERHRVWVVEGKLKEGFSHPYPRRRFYIDEDSWSIVSAALYDAADEITQVQEAFTINAYELPACVSTANVSYDLTSQSYFVSGLVSGLLPVNYRPPRLPQEHFAPDAMHLLPSINGKWRDVDLLPDWRP